MSERWVASGRVGKAHGRDGSFYVDRPGPGLAAGSWVLVGANRTQIERRAGMDSRPLVRLAAVRTREAARELGGETLFTLQAQNELGTDEWFASDLVGCRIATLGDVRRVVSGPSCDLLEVGDDGVLVPLVSQAITRIDCERKVIEVDYEFLGMAAS